jgi:glycosyltransferase involved in cell wall biosynthesis
VRILQVHTRYRFPGGEDVVVQQEAELLRAGGHDVVQHQAENPQGSVRAAVDLVTAPWHPRRATQLRRVIERVRPDVVHIHNTWFALGPAVVWSGRRPGVPVVMTLHNYRLLCANAQLYRDGRPCEDCVGTHPWHGVRHACYRGSRIQSLPAAATIAVHRRRGTWNEAVDAFIALTGFARERFIAGGLPPDRLHVKSNFVNDLGARSSLPSASNVVLFVGRLEESKGVRQLLVAWEEARTPGLQLQVIGEGPLGVELRQREWQGVRFLGALPHDDVRRRMRDARACLVPSQYYEGQPLVILEALEAGLPVGVTAIGGLPETIGDVGPDWVVAPGPADGWTRLLERVLDDDFVDAAGRRARRMFEAHYSPPVALTALERVYHHVTEARP